MSQSHTSKEYSADLQNLHQLLSQMSQAVCTQIDDVFAGLQTGDLQMLQTVRTREKSIDEFQHQINDFSVRVMALRQPVGVDLRFVLVTRDAATELERLGDYANNMAKWGKRAMESGGSSNFSDLKRIMDYVRKMLGDVITLYEHSANDDAQTAQAIDIIKQDDALDDMYVSLFRESLTYTLEDTKKITAFTHYMLILKHIERMGDLVTNLAELFYYRHRGVYPSPEETGDG